MIRPARFADIPNIMALVKRAHARSVYKDAGEIDEAEAKRLLMHGIQRHGHTNLGGMIVYVSEADDQIKAVLLGVVDRVQCFGSRYYATDLFFFAEPGVPPRDPVAMFDALCKWGASCPKVIEIVVGATNVLGSWEAAEKLYRRRGFKQRGVMYARKVQ